jgi:hypothetical protein
MGEWNKTSLSTEGISTKQSKLSQIYLKEDIQLFTIWKKLVVKESRFLVIHSGERFFNKTRFQVVGEQNLGGL